MKYIISIIAVVLTFAAPSASGQRNAGRWLTGVVSKLVSVNNILEIGAGIASYSVAFCLFGFLPLLVSGDTGTLFMGILGLFFVAYGVFRLLKKSQYYPTAR